MKVGRWKVLGLAGALALGYVVSGEAAQIKVDDKTWANFGLNMKIWYKNKDKTKSTDDWRKNEFSVGNAKIYFTGQVAPLFQFYGEFDQEKAKDQKDVVGEAGINLAFAKEFQVLAGKIRKSFTRANISSGYALLIPTGYFFNPQGASGKVTDIFTYDGNADVGLMVHGDLGGGVFTYRAGLFNVDERVKQYKDFEFNARVEFQPLMLGFKPESAATITAKVADTYLGKKDVFTIGLGFMSKKKNIEGVDKTVDGWTVDALFEKKFGNVVPNLQVGYVGIKDTHKVGSTYEDSKAWYVQGQLLYDQVVGLGKPALAVRFDSTENDKKVKGKDAKLDRIGVAFNYYIKGQAARISLGFDNAKYKDGSKAELEENGKRRSITDWYLYLQSQF